MQFHYPRGFDKMVDRIIRVPHCFVCPRIDIAPNPKSVEGLNDFVCCAKRNPDGLPRVIMAVVDFSKWEDQWKKEHPGKSSKGQYPPLPEWCPLEECVGDLL